MMSAMVITEGEVHLMRDTRGEIVMKVASVDKWGQW